MGQYQLVYVKKAKQHAKLVKHGPYHEKVRDMLKKISDDPYYSPPPYEELIGDLKGALSRRINLQHRLVYEVLPNDKNLRDENGELYQGIIKIISMWTHYE